MSNALQLTDRLTSAGFGGDINNTEDTQGSMPAAKETKISQF